MCIQFMGSFTVYYDLSILSNNHSLYISFSFFLPYFNSQEIIKLSVKYLKDFISEDLI